MKGKPELRGWYAVSSVNVVIAALERLKIRFSILSHTAKTASSVFIWYLARYLVFVCVSKHSVSFLLGIQLQLMKVKKVYSLLTVNSMAVK